MRSKPAEIVSVSNLGCFGAKSKKSALSSCRNTFHLTERNTKTQYWTNEALIQMPLRTKYIHTRNMCQIAEQCFGHK